MNKVKPLIAAAVAVAAMTTAGAGTANADTQNVPCGDHNKQAVLSTTNAFFICFEGTGPSYNSHISGVVSIWSGPYSVVAGQTGTDNPIEVPPGTTRKLDSPTDIDFVQLI